MPLARRSGGRANPEETKSTLYCSFCGKSQHEVLKLVAGPTVFICDECVELCDDIVWIESGDRIAVKIKSPPSSAFDDIFYDALSKVVDEHFPRADFRYEFRTPSKGRDRESHNLIVFSIAREKGSEVFSYSALKDEITEMSLKLAVMIQKFVHESDRAKNLADELKTLKAEAYDYLRENFRNERRPAKDLRAVMFLDISGFSKFSFENKQAVVDMLRGITPTLLGNRGASEINMWGDAIVANFFDVNRALESAVKFLRHLSVEQLDARIGMSWGEIRTNYNEATGRRDIDGPIVDLAARLEPLAPLGGILLSKEFGGIEIDKGLGDLIPVQREVKKEFASYKVGDVMDLFEFRAMRN